MRLYGVVEGFFGALYPLGMTLIDIPVLLIDCRDAFNTQGNSIIDALTTCFKANAIYSNLTTMWYRLIASTIVETP